ncbi:MAG: hypothetical protein AB1411_07215 [Nitrospirota bacterium]
MSEQGDWVGWLQYFLTGVAVQAADALQRAERINTLLVSWRKTVSGASSKVPLRLIDALATNPFITIKGAAKRLKVAFTTAQRAIEKLEEEKILKQVTDAMRERVYCTKTLLEILEQPAWPAPSSPG